MPKAWIGTSGWSYKGWVGRFYPPGLPARQQLSYLAREFPTVEINSSFYRLPAETTFAKWRDETPGEFRFAVKVSRLITHVKRMKEVDENWQELRCRAAQLGDKLGPFLFQLQSNFTAKPENRERVDRLLGCIRRLNPDEQIAFEFRHPSCFTAPMLEVLERHRAALVMADSSRFPPSPDGFAPAGYVYLRMHGPRELYASAYSQEELEAWSSLAAYHFGRGKDVYAYFDNDVNGYALEDARRLRQEFNRQLKES